MDGKKKVVIAPALYTWYRARYLIMHGITNERVLHDGVKLASSVAHLVPAAAHIKRILGEDYWESPYEAHDRFQRDAYTDPRSVVYAFHFRGILYGGEESESDYSDVMTTALAGDPFAQAYIASEYLFSITDTGQAILREMAVASARQMDPDGLLVCYKHPPLRRESQLILAAEYGHPHAQRLYANTLIAHGREHFLWLGRAAEIEQEFPEYQTAARMFANDVFNRWFAMTRQTKYQVGSSVKGFLESNAQGATAHVFGKSITGSEYDQLKRCVDLREKCIYFTKKAVRATCRIASIKGRLNRDARNIVCQMVWASRSEALYDKKSFFYF